jgi:hypothetical protein
MDSVSAALECQLNKGSYDLGDDDQQQGDQSCHFHITTCYGSYSPV